MTEQIKSTWTPAGKNLAIIIAMMPLSFVSIAASSFYSLAVIISCVAFCIGFEALIQKLLKQKLQIMDFSAAAAGIMLALLLPPSVKIWQIAAGSAVTVIIAKAFFGGNGGYVFPPVLIGRAFMFISFKSAFGAEKWLIPTESAAGMAAVAAMLLVLAFIYLIVMKVISAQAPAAFVLILAALLAVTAVISGNGVLDYTAGTLLSSASLFMAVFIVSDENIVPETKAGRIIFGGIAALITYIILIPGKSTDGAMFGILIASAMAPYLYKNAAKAVQQNAGGTK